MTDVNSFTAAVQFQKFKTYGRTSGWIKGEIVLSSWSQILNHEFWEQRLRGNLSDSRSSSPQSALLQQEMGYSSHQVHITYLALFYHYPKQRRETEEPSSIQWIPKARRSQEVGSTQPTLRISCHVCSVILYLDPRSVPREGLPIVSGQTERMDGREGLEID